MMKKVTIRTILSLLILITVSCSQTGKTGSQDSAAEMGTSNSPDSTHVIFTTAQQLKQEVQASDGKLVMINVWATWCQPCREEFPDLLRLNRNYKSHGLRLLFVSADFESELPSVKEFLRKQNVDFTTYFKSENDMDFINTLHEEWSGALPATFLYRPGGTLLDFWEGKASYAKMDSAVAQYL